MWSAGASLVHVSGPPMGVLVSMCCNHFANKFGTDPTAPLVAANIPESETVAGRFHRWVSMSFLLIKCWLWWRVATAKVLLGPSLSTPLWTRHYRPDGTSVWFFQKRGEVSAKSEVEVATMPMVAWRSAMYLPYHVGPHRGRLASGPWAATVSTR